jgi:hypothetical protein
MLNNQEFISLERRLWGEGNPLADELVSTRDELIYLLSQAKKVMEKYSPAINALSVADDLDYFREWDEFGDSIDNLTYDLGTDSSIQYKLHHEGV